MRISVIGCGWLGWPIAKRLVAEGNIVSGATTTHDKMDFLKKDGIKPFLFGKDLETIEEKNLEFFKCDICYIIIPPKRNADNYPVKIKRVLESLSPSTKIIYTSTTGVYKNTNDWVDEESVLHPIKDTSKATLQVEKAIIASNRVYIIFRLAGLTGPEREAGRFLSGKVVPGGEAPVNLVHLEDCVNIMTHKRILENVSDDVYNICSDKHPLKKELYPLLASKLGLIAPTFTLAPISFKKVSNKKIKLSLSYSFVYEDPMSF